MVEQDTVFQLGRVADDAVLSDEHRSAYERRGAHLRSLADDRGAEQYRGRIDLAAFVNPDLVRDLVVLRGVERAAKRTNKRFDARQHFPGVFRVVKQRRGKRRRKVGKQIRVFHHKNAAASSSQ